jgi:hypothetical protein
VRHAPPVSVLCRGRGWRVLQALVPGVAAAACISWLLQWAGARGAFIGIAAGAAASTAAGLAWWHAGRGDGGAPLQLGWTGVQWLADGEPAGVELMLDLGRAVLLRVLPDAEAASPRWVGVAARDVGPAWHGLRVALHGARPPGPTRVAAGRNDDPSAAAPEHRCR